ncbi:unnamed protein product [Didymodactylos carnosus]|uniref:Uncharacterized protein n=1 Tax=Didymodactylos carnosus TaxID=1234261 RepID=A0A815BQI1_9BILA|nr:unnamed protein product [Didymodactylos carnosus]CAF4063266.1 unnamed protein product [Didymodactylos carnosus]
MDDTNDRTAETSSKQPKRKEALEPLVIHEIRPWSSFAGAPADEQVLSDIDKPPSHPCLSKTPRSERLQQENAHQTLSSKQERTNRSRSALIDRKTHHHHRHSELTWRSLLCTMSDINQILTYKRFLPGHPWLQSLLIFIDSCFRGIGQVMFANNPLSGFVSSEQNYF